MIRESIDTFIEQLKKTDDFQCYERLHEQVIVNEDIERLIDLIRINQKELVQLQVRGTKSQILEKQNLVNSLTEELYEIPLYVDYMDSVLQVSILFDGIKRTMDDYILSIIE